VSCPAVNCSPNDDQLGLPLPLGLRSSPFASCYGGSGGSKSGGASQVPVGTQVSLHLKHRYEAFYLLAATNRALAAPNCFFADSRQPPNHLLPSELPRAATPLSLCLASVRQPVRPLSPAEACWSCNVRIGPEARSEVRALHAMKRVRKHAFFCEWEVKIMVVCGVSSALTPI
jgi:hypothetical protein